jgi:hypothetical protein
MCSQRSTLCRAPQQHASAMAPEAENGRDFVTKLPAELIVGIFCLLPSFTDVLALAAACHRFKGIWEENVFSIYEQAASRSIPSEIHARRFLADQTGNSSKNSVSSAREVKLMLRNARTVEKAILEFERVIVWRVKRMVSISRIITICLNTPGFAQFRPFPKHYLPFPRNGIRHPPHLTPLERSRFIRTYYFLWSFMKIDATEWPARFKCLRLKDLYLIFEISHLPQSIGNEEVVTFFWHPSHPRSVENTTCRRSQKRIELNCQIWAHIEHQYQAIHREAPEYINAYALEEGCPDFVGIWDHWQPSLKSWVCRPRGKPHQDLWDESSYASSDDEP